MNHRRILFLLLLTLFPVNPSFADWVALSINDSGDWGITVRKTSKKQAEAAALKQCNENNNGKCRIAGSSDQLGYVAVATSKTSVRASVKDTIEEAKNSALDDCAKQISKNDTCEIKWTGINGVAREQPRASDEADCRPKTREIRC